ncbi:MAG: O-antigen ligase family protein [Syntrophomonadaceae bacterium]|nr:O-antigen ligase family protein [Syntrophomonadaceae bacterium]
MKLINRELSGRGWPLLPASYSKAEALCCLGVCLLILASPLLQGLFYEIEFMPDLLVLGFIMAVGLIVGRARLPVNKTVQPLDIAMFGLVLAYLLSLTTAIHQHQAVIGLLQMCSYCMVYWIASRIGSEALGFKGLLASAYLAAIIMSLAGLAAALGWVDWVGFYNEGEGLICSTLQYHNALAVYVAAASLIGLALVLQTESRLFRLLLAGGNYLLIIVLIGTLSRGTWLVYPLGLAVLIGLMPANERMRTVLYTLWTLVTAMVAGRFFFAQIDHSSGIALIILLLGLAAALLIPWFMPQRLQFKLPMINVSKRIRLVLAGCLTLVFITLLVLYYPKLTVLLPQNAVARLDNSSFQDGSIQERLLSYQDAVKIIKDHPLTGSGGGGWAALYQQYAERPYYTKELHNYYLKVAVEAGLIGFGMLLAVILFIFKLLISRRREGREELPNMYWGAFAALIVLGIHAAGDFELSYPGVAFFCFALLGALRGLGGDQPPQPHLSGNKLRNRKASAQLRINRVNTLLNVSIWGMTLLVLLSASGWVISYISAQAGKQALIRNDLIKAQSHYDWAVLFSPWNPQYRVGLAFTAARIATDNEKGEAYRQAQEQGAMAASLEPYGLETRLNLINLYTILQDPQRQAEACRVLVKAAPFEPRAYKMAAESLMNGARISLQQSDSDSAGGYLLQWLEIRAAMPDTIKDLPAEIDLAAGQAALLTGRLSDAGTYLRKAAANKDTRNTAKYWLKALETISAEPDHMTGAPLQEMDAEMLRGLLEHW